MYKTPSSVSSTKPNASGSSSPSTSTKPNASGSSSPSTSTKPNASGSSSPSTSTKPNASGSSSPSKSTKPNASGSSSPSKSTKPNASGSSSPSTSTKTSSNINMTSAAPTRRSSRNSTIAATQRSDSLSAQRAVQTPQPPKQRPTNTSKPRPQRVDVGTADEAIEKIKMLHDSIKKHIESKLPADKLLAAKLSWLVEDKSKLAEDGENAVAAHIVDIIANGYQPFQSNGRSPTSWLYSEIKELCGKIKGHGDIFKFKIDRVAEKYAFDRIKLKYKHLKAGNLSPVDKASHNRGWTRIRRLVNQQTKDLKKLEVYEMDVKRALDSFFYLRKKVCNFKDEVTSIPSSEI